MTGESIDLIIWLTAPIWVTIIGLLSVAVGMLPVFVLLWILDRRPGK